MEQKNRRTAPASGLLKMPVESHILACLFWHLKSRPLEPLFADATAIPRHTERFPFDPGRNSGLTAYCYVAARPRQNPPLSPQTQVPPALHTAMPPLQSDSPDRKRPLTLASAPPTFRLVWAIFEPTRSILAKRNGAVSWAAPFTKPEGIMYAANPIENCAVFVCANHPSPAPAPRSPAILPQRRKLFRRWPRPDRVSSRHFWHRCESRPV